jgi:hypothetical protein
MMVNYPLEMPGLLAFVEAGSWLNRRRVRLWPAVSDPQKISHRTDLITGQSIWLGQGSI